MSAMMNPDGYGAASHRNMIEHLCGPFSAGAVDSAVAITAAGRVEVAIATREPLLLIAPLVALEDRRMQVDVTLDPDGVAPLVLPPLQFDAYTEEGAYLPADVPAVEPDTRTSAPFVLQLKLSFRDRDDQPLVVPVPDVSALLQARLVEGSLGKVLYALGAEKQRLRRQAREVLAMRALSAARWDALDRFGADLGVPRFADRLQYDAAREEIVAVTREAGGEPFAEPDAEYRRRLKLYHGWNMPTRAAVAAVLNGDGAAQAPNTGLLGELGIAQRFTIEERNNAFAVAVHIVAGPAGALARTNFFKHLADTRLIFPAEFAVNDPHALRLLSSDRRKALAQQRQNLRDRYDWTQTMAVAPALADALERAGRVLALLQPAGAAKLHVQRAFDPAAGSRYELGLGIDIDPLPTAAIDQMHAQLGTPGFLAGLDAGDAAQLSGLASRPAAEDELGAWLFEHCGLPTVHGVSATTVYLSSLPTFGLVINESAVQPGNDVLALEALYQAPGDPGTNAALEAGIAATLADWAASGEEAIARVPRAQLEARWRANIAQPAAARNVFLAGGLPAPQALPPLAPSLDRVPAELVDGVELGPNLSNAIVTGAPDGARLLRKLVEILRSNHVSSALPVIDAANRVTLVLAAIGLPEAGINLSERRTSGFRWYAVPIEGGIGNVSPVGARAIWRKADGLLTALVVIGYARRGLVDPYEYRVDLPAGATLNLEQYEFLMNALERLYPLGVQVNTFAIRREHVKLRDDGAGAEPLPPTIMRTYRKFQRRHRRGEAGVGLQTESTQT